MIIGTVDEEGYYHPHPDEALPSPVPGMSVGVYERLAEKIIWFSSLSLQERIRSLEEEKDLQSIFDRMQIVRDGT